MLDRIIGVLKLDVDTYEEIEADESATTQAAIIVAVVAIVSALIAGVFATLGDGSFLGEFLRQLINAFVAWLIWSYVTYFVGTSIFKGVATPGEMLRVLGYAQVPSLLAIIPICGAFIGFIWTLICSFIAIRQGLDLDNTKALFTAIVAFIVVLVVYFVIGLILGAVGLGVDFLGDLI